MTDLRHLSDLEMQALLDRARASKAPASIRAVGSVRLLGDLHVNGLEAGRALHLGGAKRRDQLPPRDTPVGLSLLLGDEVLALQSTMLDPIISEQGDTLFPPVLRLSWPRPGVEFHRRCAVRVATPDLPSLPARLAIQGTRHEATLLNLNETGMGLGLASQMLLDLHAQVEVETDLPGGVSLRATGEVRHLEWLDDDPMPTRIGLVLGQMSEGDREALRRFIQARRTVRSEALRNG
jgi:hypothetical protein